MSDPPPLQPHLPLRQDSRTSRVRFSPSQLNPAHPYYEYDHQQECPIDVPAPTQPEQGDHYTALPARINRPGGYRVPYLATVTNPSGVVERASQQQQPGPAYPTDPREVSQVLGAQTGLLVAEDSRGGMELVSPRGSTYFHQSPAPMTGYSPAGGDRPPKQPPPLAEHIPTPVEEPAAPLPDQLYPTAMAPQRTNPVQRADPVQRAPSANETRTYSPMDPPKSVAVKQPPPGPNLAFARLAPVLVPGIHGLDEVPKYPQDKLTEQEQRRLVIGRPQYPAPKVQHHSQYPQGPGSMLPQQPQPQVVQQPQGVQGEGSGFTQQVQAQAAQQGTGLGIMHHPKPQIGFQPATPEPMYPQQPPPAAFPEERRKSDETLARESGANQMGYQQVYPASLYPAQVPPGEARRKSDETLAEEFAPDSKAFQNGQQEGDVFGAGASVPKPQHAGWQNGENGEGFEMGRKRTTEVENGEEEDEHRVRGGVFSQLLRLYGGDKSVMRKRQSTGATSMGRGIPTLKSLGLQRVDSSATTMSKEGGGDMDPDDPRLTGVKGKKKAKNARRQSLGDFVFNREEGMGGRKRASIQKNIADILTRQNFVLKLARALMTFGAPSHRLESQLNATAQVLDIDAQFIHLPSIVIASFGDQDTRTSETHFVKANGGLNLGSLHKVHKIYRQVVHDEITAGEGTIQINELLRAPPLYNLWKRLVIAFVCSAVIAPMGFGGSFIDAFASGALGCLLSFMQLGVASKNAMYSNIFEISIATIVSFAARGLSTTNYFCYQAVSSAGVVLILPGYAILCGSLELASKNIVAGSVRMVYAIIYSLFLGFGISIGSDLFYLFDPAARHNAAAVNALKNHVLTITGTFTPVNGTAPWAGAFTFNNGTMDATQAALASGSIICAREPHWEWWRQTVPRLWLILLVPFFAFFNCLWNSQPVKSKQLPVMVVISCIGYITNALADHYIFNRSDVVSAIGAFVIGVLGNTYARVFGGTAFTTMVPGVLFLVPGGLSAAGGLAEKTDNSFGALTLGFRMVQVAIGITVGLFGSGLLIYSFGRKKGAALFAF